MAGRELGGVELSPAACDHSLTTFFTNSEIVDGRLGICSVIRPDSVGACAARLAAVADFACASCKLLVSLLILPCIAGSAGAAEIVTYIPETGPATVLVRGELTVSDGLRFTEKTDNIQEAVVRFESPGGMMIAGLGIGRTIRRKGFVTVVPSAAQCASACALAWLGGSQRYMAENARIGFHAAYFMRYGRPHRSDAAEAAVVDYLEQLQLPQRAISYMTNSPPQGLNMLTMGRARDLGVAVSSYRADEITGSVDEMAAKPPLAIKLLPQVDLYGSNLPGMPVAAETADECAAQCTAEQNCAAFTFNTAHSVCFLKASVEIAVSHPSAVSGLRADLEQGLGRTRMFIAEATDYPGNDIDRQTDTTFEACLLSCGETRTCKAFTYVIHRHECWLKNAIGSAEPRDGLVSGVK
jgi:hypothetical protein